MKKIIRTICDLFEKGESIVLATILSHAGSTPRTSGAKMVICSNGKNVGTIGGGLVEARVIQAALDVFKTNQVIIRDFDLSGFDVIESMDVICGGRLEVLIEKIDPIPINIQIFKEMLSALNQGKRCLLISILPDRDNKDQRIKRFLLADGRAVLEDNGLPRMITETITEKAVRCRTPALITIEDRTYLVEPTAMNGTVYLFGAGHVSRQVAILTHRVDFRTVVLDDRAEYANRKRFETADEIRILSDFTNALSDLDMDQDSYVVIVTRGHRHDKTVLSQALKTNAGYIGMIGSRRKRDTIYKALMAEGFTSEALERVHCPVGLKIGAETPQEIAVSIVAELIEVRANQQKGIHE
jgi:xanthine dehydrogenase accessory factor